MEIYWNKVDQVNDIERGMFLILPLKYDETIFMNDLSVMGEKPIAFESNDFVSLLTDKCSLDGNFVRRYKIDVELTSIQEIIKSTDLQLFVFYNGIAFLTVYLSYLNRDVGQVYQFIYPGYTNEEEKIKKLQTSLLKEIEDKILVNISPVMHWFLSDKMDTRFLLKEAYRLHVAYVPKRFEETDVVNRITYNEHRIIDLSDEFQDLSEKDIAYVTGARDVNTKDYGWGCCITSQEISYAYVKGNMSLIDRATDDLLLTILVMYQKYTCMSLNEEIHKRYISNNTSVLLKKSILELKKEALEFIAYGTLAPSQISRWNNVCETYRLLIELNGINETILEIEGKINLLNEEQERLETKRESTIGLIIAVFGLISIIASVLQIVDYVSTGKVEMLISFTLSIVSVLIFAILSIRVLNKKHKENI